MSDLPIDHDTTRATANLPGLTVEVTRRRAPGGDAEEISINMQAVPSFVAFGRYLDGMNPFAIWAQFAQAMWAPFLGPWAGLLLAKARPRRHLPQIRNSRGLKNEMLPERLNPGA